MHEQTVRVGVAIDRSGEMLACLVTSVDLGLGAGQAGSSRAQEFGRHCGP